MKRIMQVVFLLAGAVALAFALYFLVQQRSGAEAAARPVMTRQVQPESSAETRETGGNATESPGAANPVPALANEVILNVTTINVDLDEADEQVLTVRNTDRGEGRLSIVVLDYNEQKKAWLRTWEGETLATKLTTFSIQAKDLLGDHSLCLVCSGMNDSGDQTTAVFLQMNNSSSYKEIFSIAADSFEIDEKERPEEYQTGSAAAESWSISVYSRDTASSNLLDQVKDKYAWNPKSGMYEKAGSERITGAQVEREIVARVLTGSEKDFELFLQGVWYKADKEPFDPNTRLINFDKASESISFYKPEAQEAYSWTESHATRNGIYVRCKNETVEGLVRLLDIELTGADLVGIQVLDDQQMKANPDDRWDGSYRRLPRDIPSKDKGAATHERQGLAKSAIKLDGAYIAKDGTELDFSGNRYSLKSKLSPMESGGFELYSLGDSLMLDLIAVRPDGMTAARKTYRAQYKETKAGRDSIVRRLALSPAKAAIDGIELLQEQDMILEQRTGG